MIPPWPTELRLNKGGDQLVVTFDDGETYRLDAEYLRVMTGSAEDRGHGAGPRPPIPGKKTPGCVNSKMRPMIPSIIRM